jgi:hypothetical protein
MKVGGDRRCQWQRTAGERLGEAQDVRHRLGRRGEQRASAAEAGHDLVGDHQHTVPITGGADEGQSVHVVEPHAASALDTWFDDHCRDLAGMVGKYGLECRLSGGIARQRGKDLRHAVVDKGVVETAAGIGDRERAKGVAVVTIEEGNEVLARLSVVTPVLYGDL